VQGESARRERLQLHCLRGRAHIVYAIEPSSFRIQTIQTIERRGSTHSPVDLASINKGPRHQLPRALQRMISSMNSQSLGSGVRQAGLRCGAVPRLAAAGASVWRSAGCVHVPTDRGLTLCRCSVPASCLRRSSRTADTPQLQRSFLIHRRTGNNRVRATAVAGAAAHSHAAALALRIAPALPRRTRRSARAMRVVAAASNGQYDYDIITIGAGSGGVRGSRFAASYGAPLLLTFSVLGFLGARRGSGGWVGSLVNHHHSSRTTQHNARHPAFRTNPPTHTHTHE